jgi:hypothetical protein
MASAEDLRARFRRIVSAPRAQPAAPAAPTTFFRRPFSAYVNEDVDAAAAISARLSAINRDHGGGIEGLGLALAEAERLLPQEAVRGLVQYALQLFARRDAEARRLFHPDPLEQRQPNAVLGPRPPAGDEHNDNEE